MSPSGAKLVSESRTHFCFAPIVRYGNCFGLVPTESTGRPRKFDAMTARPVASFLVLMACSLGS